ncbi:MAG: PAS domain-containing sensor histidine kinase, partial [Rhodothalassiaceae bacterium]
MVASNVALRAAGEEAPRDYEFRLRHVDGSVIWVNCRARITNWKGAPAVIASLFDISEQKRAETERLFERVFELSPDVITLSRVSDGTFRFVNDAFLTTMGFAREEVIGRNSKQLRLWKNREQRRDLVQRLAKEGIVHNFECQMRRSDGTILDMAMSVTTLPYLGEDYLLLVGRDMTEYNRQQRELRRSKEAAEAANRTKSEFLANISHELRTPLNAIIGFSELMQRETLGPLGHEHYRGYCADILDAGRHLLAIINDILDLSKLEAGRLTVERERVSIDEIFEPCVRLVSDRAEKAGLELRVEAATEAGPVLGDIRRLRQVMLNLLSNAVKFTPAGGRVVIGAVAEDRERTRLFVSDTGIGMSEAELEKALTPFGQIDSSLARRYEGAGLGLPLVKALVEMQGGRFVLESAPGAGTCASAILPRAERA